MFDHLVESTSHKDDIARKGSFILGTVVVYIILGTALFVAGIYWYDAQLENQNLELTTLVAPVPVMPQQQQAEPEKAKPADQPKDQAVATRTELVARVDQPIAPKEVSAVASKVPPIPKGVPVALGTSNTEATVTGPIGSGSGIPGGTGTAPAPVVKLNEDPPPPAPDPTPKKPTAPISGGVLNGKAISLPKPQYPAIARTARASGQVTVQVTIDENGSVISARAVGGHPLLQAAAVAAARGARFSPTKLSGQPVKVTGVITYNFLPQ
ncbi:MAG TPA: TonB family protein [Pyrinomonadaceae bacterium]|jgi:protein TonB|nr:TonB family protein [Pyrinomonadaceae bacterium]